MIVLVHELYVERGKKRVTLTTYLQWELKSGIRIIDYMRPSLGAVVSGAHSLSIQCQNVYITVPQIDFSKQLIPWIVKEGYSLLDINLFPKPYFPSVPETRVCSESFLVFSLQF